MTKEEVIKLNDTEVSWDTMAEIIDDREEDEPLYMVALKKVYQPIGEWHVTDAMIFDFETMELLAKVVLKIDEKQET